MAENPGNVKAALDAVLPLYGVQVLSDCNGDTGIAVVPSGMRLEVLKPHLDQYLARPERKKGTTVLTELLSFCRFVSRHKTEATVVFLNDSDPERASLTAVFNAHEGVPELKEPGEGEGESAVSAIVGDNDGADHQDFRAVYEFPFSIEWKRWRDIGKKSAISQKEFAELLEDVIQDVIDPSDPGKLAAAYAKEVCTTLASPSQLLALSRGLRIQVNSTAEVKYDPQSGAETIAYSVEHRDSKGDVLRPPGAFAIGIPVFRNDEELSKLPVRLRYNEAAGKITWRLSMQRCEEVLEEALNLALAVVQKETLITPFRGIG